MTRIITDETHALRRRVERLEARVLDLTAELRRLLPKPSQRLPDPETHLTVMSIVDDVAETHGLTQAEILGRNRQAHIVRARHECFGIAKGAGVSYADIGRSMGRDHTAIMHGVKKWNSGI